MLTMLIYFVLALVLFGFALWVIESAPFISATIKPTIRWFAIVAIGLFCIVFLLHLLGLVHLPPLR